MSNIIAYVGIRPAVPILLDGFRRLEDDDCNSAGLAYVSGQPACVRMAAGKVEDLAAELEGNDGGAFAALGCMNWGPAVFSGMNDRVHVHSRGRIAVVQEGHIENIEALRNILTEGGHRFETQSDTEVVAHLIEARMAESVEEAVCTALSELKGKFSIAVLAAEAESVYGLSSGDPLIVGLGRDECYLSTASSAIQKFTKSQVKLDPGEVGILSRRGFRVIGLLHRRPVLKTVNYINTAVDLTDKNGYAHYILKEIHEQPQIVRTILSERIHPSGCSLVIPDLPVSIFETVERFRMVGCGSSYHAGLIGKYFIEKVLRIPVEVNLSSEFLDQDPIIDKNTLTLAISRSGETEETLAAMSEASQKGSPVIALCNEGDSRMALAADAVFGLRTGREIGVTSTKTFTAQILGLLLVTLYAGQVKNLLSKAQIEEHLKSISSLPDLMALLLVREREIKQWSDRFSDRGGFLLFGRGLNYPVAMEGALKFKELSHIHAEGFPFGEFGRGPIALIEKNYPIVALVPETTSNQRLLSNLEKVRSRNGTVLAIATEGQGEIGKIADLVFYLPPAAKFLHPFLMSVPLQLLAYNIGVLRKCVMDRKEPFQNRRIAE